MRPHGEREGCRGRRRGGSGPDLRQERGDIGSREGDAESGTFGQFEGGEREAAVRQIGGSADGGAIGENEGAVPFLGEEIHGGASPVSSPQAMAAMADWPRWPCVVPIRTAMSPSTGVRPMMCEGSAMSPTAPIVGVGMMPEPSVSL